MTPTNLLTDIITRERAARVHDLMFAVLLVALVVFSIASLTTAG